MGRSVRHGPLGLLSPTGLVFYKHGSECMSCVINMRCLVISCRWILGISPSGSNDLLLALRLIFEGGEIFEEDLEGK